MTDVGLATDLAYLDLAALQAIGVELTPDTTNEVLVARIAPAIAASLMAPSPFMAHVRKMR